MDPAIFIVFIDEQSPDEKTAQNKKQINADPAGAEYVLGEPSGDGSGGGRVLPMRRDDQEDCHPPEDVKRDVTAHRSRIGNACRHANDLSGLTLLPGQP